MSISLTMPVWAYAYGLPAATGKIKSQPADFIVEELLPFQPEGNEEHVFLQVQKQNENTEYVARLLARFADVRQRDIGFAGLKDRYAITTQWFSVWLPGKADPDWPAVETENIKILQAVRHPRKLKRGVLTGNNFTILIRDFAGDKEKIIQKLAAIKTQGFPNYFGEQRFGNNGQNINTALALFNGAKIKREQHSIYLSAARSFLFNLMLCERVELQNWNQAISGDVFMFNNSNSYFKAENSDETLQQRVANGEIHPTACLYGKGENAATQNTLAIENQIIDAHPELAEGLVKFAVEIDRRALRIFPENMQWKFLNSEQLELTFFLTAGSYATALLRELIA
jgi:tRNA pseudouridine13 synthase